MIITENNRVLTINTSLIPLKTTKSTQGVQVVRQPKTPVVPSKVEIASESVIDNAIKYVARSIPAAAKTLKDEDGQLSLF